ncbi:unnamed protein product [Staurois parvus]|uniref:Uncharacterized protein n=1 Tax=Staurois parvus TaxID=386267 RepID=A0ABN9HY89_9NEOB|nr:unnamed protein product [Staurois parvus]
MFSQEFIISLNTLQKIGKITIENSQIRSLCIETSTSKDPTNFEHCVEREFEHVEGQFHTEEITRMRVWKREDPCGLWSCIPGWSFWIISYTGAF